MSNGILLFILLFAIILVYSGIVIIPGKLPKNKKIGIIICEMGVPLLLAGLYLLPATSWRSISITCLVIAVVLFVAGIIIAVKGNK